MDRDCCVRLEKTPLKPCKCQALVLRSVDLQIEAVHGKKPNGQILKPRAQACESYA